MMHRIIFPLFLITLCVFGVADIVSAVDDDFIVRQNVGFDTTPPTIPAGLTATPVATSQINLAWGTSTDDYVLSGYQVFRDDIQIATTTGITYSDTGLYASTTYTYYVTAFDASNNISASSTAVATTTLATSTPPAVATSTPSRQGTRFVLELIRLEIIPSQNSVILRYETRGHTRTVVRWGTSISYELGSLAEQSFSKVHETKIMGLRPGSKYKFIIEGENSIGMQGVLTEDVFTTLPPDDIFPPANVSNLRAVREGDDIVLSWVNPKDVDLSNIRVIRNDQFYPSDTADGWVVYEGLGESVRDSGMAIEGTRQFYTVFTYDALGNISSGAIVGIRIEGESTTPIEVIDETLNPIALRLTDFEFIQDGELLPVTGIGVAIDGSKQLTISLSYTLVPEHLKTILVTLLDEEGKEFAFLLRVNTEKTAYIAHLAPLGVSGIFPIRIAIFDFKTAQIGYTHGEIISHIVNFEEAEEGTAFFTFILHMLTSYFFWFIVLLLTLTYTGWRLLTSPEKDSQSHT